jgi:hypothetical protein
MGEEDPEIPLNDEFFITKEEGRGGCGSLSLEKDEENEGREGLEKEKREESSKLIFPISTFSISTFTFPLSIPIKHTPSITFTSEGRKREFFIFNTPAVITMKGHFTFPTAEKEHERREREGRRELGREGGEERIPLLLNEENSKERIREIRERDFSFFKS